MRNAQNQFKLTRTEPLWEFVSKLDDLAINSNFNEHFLNIGDVSPWANDKFKKTYLQYYMPLNTLRLLAVVVEGLKTQFFEHLDTVIDYGSGPGTFEYACLEAQLNFSHKIFVETSKEATLTHQSLRKLFFKNVQPTEKWEIKIPQDVNLNTTLQVFSYSLIEQNNFSADLFKSEALLIVEPSTQPAGRRLQELRKTLIELGYNVWAPCTHQSDCPLLSKSEKDWCHHRIHIILPECLKKIHSNLPIRNDTLTFSYLLARKKKISPRAYNARIIGDTLFERGKVRQAVCRGPNREFLSWLTKHGEPEMIPRGQVITIPENIEIKGNELRMPR